MTPIQQLFLGVGASKKTYLDDVFSTYIYEGSGSAGNQVTNGIDVSGQGGMVWIKPRGSGNHYIVDSQRNSGAGILNTNTNDASANNGNLVSSLNSNGFTLGSLGNANTDGDSYASWTFRKTKGFFDVVTYTGDGATSRNISHSLGSVPGMIMIKKTNGSANWAVYHRSTTASKYLSLNTNDGANNGSEWFADGTEPTASVFSVGNQGIVNGDGDTYVAYIFAGGASTTDKAVELDGTNDYLTIPDNDAWNLGNTFTIEAWVNLDALNDYNVIIAQGSGDWYMSVNSNGSCQFYDFTGAEQIDSAASAVSTNTWTHIAIVANAGTAQWYVNGVASGSSGSLNVQGGSNSVSIGAQGSNYKFNGEISNLRVTKGQALYKANFNVPHDPLTQTSQKAVSSNVKLLCCNGSTATASTVTPDTISATGSPSVTTNSSIFDDSAAFTFGESGSESVIKTGSYVGNGSTAGPELNLGWEPQLVIIKAAGISQDWYLADVMRGILTGSDVFRLQPSTNAAETEGGNRFDVTSTGLQFNSTDNEVNGNGDKYIYIAIRRPDGYVGKPAEAGTDVFNMVMSNGSVYNSGFPVDFAFYRKPTASYDWWTVGRLIQGKELKANENNAESSWTGATFDSNDSWGTSVQDNTHQSWMWKRHAGFDVVAYTGDEVAGRQIPHSLNAVPEMMWVKKRSGSKDWICYHKGLNGETNPEQYHLHLNTNVAEAQSVNAWNNQAPTSTHFVVADDSHVNESDEPYLTMLFASVDGISKVGYYDGSDSEQTITTGFQPRFVIIKNISITEDWFVLDTLRGWASGTDENLRLNKSDAQENSHGDLGDPTSTGFTVIGNNSAVNNAGEKFIYYAHA